MDLVTLSKLLLLSGCISHVTANPKVVSMPISRNAKRSSIARRDPGSVTLSNRVQDAFYSVNVSVGTPPQQLLLDVDTGSSDIWYFNPSACQESGCVDGTFDPTKSITYSLVSEGTFNISYADQSSAEGDYISDVIDLGNGLKVTNQTMALATSAEDNQYGLFGIAFRNNEANEADYPTFVESLVTAGVIKSQSYSLWLDDLQASTGTLLFGGYDPDQWVGDITIIPILADADEEIVAGQEVISSFTVDLSMVALTAGSGGQSTILQQDEYPIPAILDSGTTLTQLPPDSFYQLAEYFGATYDQGGYVVSCDIANWKGTVDFGFGGSGGAIIQVPFSELAISQGNDTAGLCQFGLDLATDVPLIGDTFLRSAYVIYDIDAKQIGIAQSKFGSETSNPKEIGAGDDLAALVSGSRDDTTATLDYQYYTSLAYQVASTDVPDLSGNAQTASITGVKTSLSVVAAPTAPPASTGTAASKTSTAGGAVQTAAMLLPMALPFAAALL